MIDLRKLNDQINSLSFNYFHQLSVTLILMFLGSNSNAQINIISLPKYEACILRAPEINLSGNKTIAVIGFKEDNTNSSEADLGVRLASLIQEALTTDYYGANEDKIFMTKVRTDIYKVVERVEIDKIIQEIKFDVSGMVDEETASNAGKILGADLLITGHIGYTSKDKTTEKTIKGETITKVKRTLVLSGAMNVISVETGEVLNTIAPTIEEKSTQTAVTDLATVEELIERALKQMAMKMCLQINPYYENVELEIFNLKRDNKENGKNAHKLLKIGKMQDAFCDYYRVFTNDNYNERAVFNLGTIYEAMGNYPEAAKYYNLAYQINNRNGRIKAAYERSNLFESKLETLNELGINVIPGKLDSEGCGKVNKAVVKVGRRKKAKIFSKPNSSATQLAEYPDGMKLIWVKEEGDFLQIKMSFPHEGKMGYIRKSEAEQM